MTTQEYRSADSVNFSSLKSILDSPAHYIAAITKKREETKAMLLGTLTHSCVLEGKMLNEIAAIKPDGLSLATKDGKEWKAFHEERKLPIISDQEAEDISGMVASIRLNPHAAAMLNACFHRETPVFSNLRGVNCKCLIDAHGTDGKDWVICDLKTTDDASPDAFSRKVANYHYDMQAAMYCDILARQNQAEEQPQWFWLAVEKTAPYTSVVYSSNEWMQSGADKLEKALEIYKECKRAGQWPQPYSGINELPKPKWV